MKSILAIAAVAAVAGTASAQIVVNGAVESFDNTDNFTTSEPFFSDGFGDFFTNDPTAVGTFIEYTGGDDNFLLGMDLDGEGASLPITLDITGISIAGFTDLMFSADLAEDDSSDGNEDWDDSDFVSFEYQIDGGGYLPLYTVANDGSQFNAVPSVYLGADNTGTNLGSLTSTFANFGADIAGTGSSLDLRITFQLNAGDEDIAIDNLAITGVPTPGAGALLGLAGVAGLRRRRA